MDDTLGVYISLYGVKPNGEDQSANINLALASGNTKFIFPKGIIRVDKKIQINNRAVEFIGHNNGRSQENATILEFYGEGEFISLGNSSTPGFSGQQGFTLRQISLIYKGSSRGNLKNPFAVSASNGWYGTGTYGIRDWRGGGIKLIDAQIEHFEYGVWGTQSDINRFNNLQLFYNKCAIYMEEKSDQFLGEGLYTFGNDNTITMVNCTGGRFLNCQFVKEGSQGTYPVELNGCFSMLFAGNWYESTGNYGATVPAYIRLGASSECRNIVIRSSTLAVGDKINGTVPQVNYFIEVVTGRSIVIDEAGGYLRNLKKLVGFSGGSSIQDVYVKLANTVPYSDGKYHDENGTGRAAILIEQHDENGKTVMGLTRTKAQAGSVQRLTGGLWTRIALDKSAFDELGEFDNVNYQWTAKHTGYYRITSLQMTGVQQAGNRLQLALFLNTGDSTGGTPWTFLDDRTSPVTGGGAVSGSVEVKVNAGYKIDLRMLSTNDTTLLGGSSNYLIITRI
ncbi:hypothetical protein JI735_29225 [Paenibacillus sonchi]|uniref:Uncharacterized protein n=1 Tax=Paenibacillus sonchi TaxID=373687 RepID=A0A974PB34_9BACL|nr:hypothetical protein [Paenibacillus sonchi]QQZ60526.1 hypothetical protein JI735_29225 [Paenibacillus sonchi]